MTKRSIHGLRKDQQAHTNIPLTANKKDTGEAKDSMASGPLG